MAYLSSGDTANAAADAEQVIKIKPDWPKGYSRKGAALSRAGDHTGAVAAFEEGLKAVPGDATLSEGLKSAVADKEAAEKFSAGPPGGMFGGANPFGPEMFGKLAANPKFAPYLADPSFVAKLNQLQANPNDLQSAASDPRLIEVLGFLLGIPMAAGTPEPFAPTPAPAPAPKEPEPEPEPPRELTPEEAKEAEMKKEAADLKAQGTAAYRKREFEEALRLYAAADNVNPAPGDISFKLNMAAVHFEKKDFEQCIAVCDNAIEVGRENRAQFNLLAKAFARIGNAHVRTKNLVAAIEAYEQSLMESHTDDVYMRLKKAKADMKKAEELAYLDPEKAAAAKAEGNEAFKAGNFVDAITHYSEAIKRDPAQAVFWANRGAARTKLMDFNAAMKDVDQAIKLDPTYVKAYSRKGALQYLMKEYHKAMESYEAGIKLDPENVECKEGLQRTIMQINATMGGGGDGDPERAQRAMADPEIQGILRDPVVQQVLRDFNENPTAARAAMADPGMSAKISKLVASGVLKMQ